MVNEVMVAVVEVELVAAELQITNLLLTSGAFNQRRGCAGDAEQCWNIAKWGQGDAGQ